MFIKTSFSIFNYWTLEMYVDECSLHFKIILCTLWKNSVNWDVSDIKFYFMLWWLRTSCFWMILPHRNRLYCFCFMDSVQFKAKMETSRKPEMLYDNMFQRKSVKEDCLLSSLSWKITTITIRTKYGWMLGTLWEAICSEHSNLRQLYGQCRTCPSMPQ